MPDRSETFATPGRQGLLDHPLAHLLADEVKGPLKGFNPTRAQFDIAPSTTLPTGYGSSSGDGPKEAPKAGDAQWRWRARDNRKGRHVLLLPKDHHKTGEGPQLTTTWSAIGKGIWRMCTVMAYWDVSWWIAVLFSVGSAIFVVSGFFYWLPLVAPSTTFPDEDTIGGGVTAFVGATLFTIGGVLLIVEAVNENQTGCFGWALEQVVSHTEQALTHTHSDSDTENGSQTKKGGPAIRPADCVHHHSKGVHRSDVLQAQHPNSARKWEWWPSWQELRDHYFHEIGFWASFILAIGAVVFYISGIMALPWIYNNTPQGVLWGVYWLAYLVGGILFVVSSVLYMFETQPNWYTPAPRVLGWWIGTWNMIGSVGWTLSASFGYCSASWCAYQSDLSLLWASAAFLIGSLLLWYESLDKYPVISGE